MRFWDLDLGDTVKRMNILEVILYYTNTVNKDEYPDFDCWKADMMKHGLLTKVAD